MKAQANQIRPGWVLDHNGKQYSVTKIDIIQPGKGGAFIQVEMRDVSNGVKTQQRWRTADTVEKLMSEEFDCTYLYKEGTNLIFMNSETYDQFEVPQDLMGDAALYLQDNMGVQVNFIEGKPISVALKYRDEITAAVLFNPIANELYYAEKGQGFFVMTATGNKRLRVSGRNDLRSAMIGLNNKEEKIAVKIANKVGTLRHFGSNALELAAVGAGQLDAVILSKAPVWDIATASLFIKEAGGRMATMTGKTDLKDLIEADMILATNLSLFPKLERELK